MIPAQLDFNHFLTAVFGFIGNLTIFLHSTRIVPFATKTENWKTAAVTVVGPTAADPATNLHLLAEAAGTLVPNHAFAF